MITVYSKPNCPYCDMAKQYLEKNDIFYEDIDITKNTEARDILIRDGHKTVPQIYHKGELLVEGGGTALSRMNPNTVRELIGDINVSDFKL